MPWPPLKGDTLRLYSMRFCPYAQRARLVLAHKHIPSVLIQVFVYSTDQVCVLVDVCSQTFVYSVTYVHLMFYVPAFSMGAHLYIHKYIHMYTKYMCVYKSLLVRLSVRLFVCPSIYPFIYLYVSVCVFINPSICVCACTHMNGCSQVCTLYIHAYASVCVFVSVCYRNMHIKSTLCVYDMCYALGVYTSFCENSMQYNYNQTSCR